MIDVAGARRGWHEGLDRLTDQIAFVAPEHAPRLGVREQDLAVLGNEEDTIRRRLEQAAEHVLALRKRLADAGLPADVVELVPAGFIPRTTSGKLRRGAARARWQSPDPAGGEAGLPGEVPPLGVGDEG